MLDTNKQHTHMITEVWGMQWDMPQLHSRTPTIPLLSTGRSRVGPALAFGLQAAPFRIRMDLGCVALRLCLPPELLRRQARRRGRQGNLAEGNNQPRN